MIPYLLCNVWENTENIMDEFYEFLDSIQSFSQPLTENDVLPILNGEPVNTHEYIYGKTYKFNRFDTALIQHIRDHEDNYFFHVNQFDERFINPKYYQINTTLYMHRNCFFYNEMFTLNYSIIMEDLYYKRFIYPNTDPNPCDNNANEWQQQVNDLQTQLNSANKMIEEHKTKMDLLQKYMS